MDVIGSCGIEDGSGRVDVGEGNLVASAALGRNAMSGEVVTKKVLFKNGCCKVKKSLG